MSPRRPVTALLVNENIGGHATVHHHLRRVAAERSDIRIRIVDVPAPGFWRKAAGVAIPGLSRFDADLRPVRYQLAQSAWVARQIPRWLTEIPGEQVDVVHLYTHNVGLLAQRALRAVPYVVTLDSTNAQSNLLHPVREPTRASGWSTPCVRPFERRVYLGARTVVANSGWTAASLVDDYGIDPEHIRTLPMGVPLPAAAPPASERKGLPRLLFIGRRMARKGGYDLLAAHQQWLSDRCELILVTGDAVPPGRNVEVINDIEPGDGRIDELLAGSDVMLLPSRLDQWPNAVMEAMSHGVPPIVSSVGGMPEMVLNGEAGIVLDTISPESIRDAVTSLLDNPGKRAELGRRARQRVVDDLDVRLTANHLLDVIRDAAR